MLYDDSGAAHVEHSKNKRFDEHFPVGVKEYLFHKPSEQASRNLLAVDGESSLSSGQEASVGTLAGDPRAVTLTQLDGRLPGTSCTELGGINAEGQGVAANGVVNHQEIVRSAVLLVGTRPHVEAQHTGARSACNLVDKVQGELLVVGDGVGGGHPSGDVNASGSEAIQDGASLVSQLAPIQRVRAVCERKVSKRETASLVVRHIRIVLQVGNEVLEAIDVANTWK